MKVTFKLETFEGPLDLLLHLIDTAEVDIYDIPIKEITEQYMEYLSHMQELELGITSEFLVMAATLLAIKSQMLLPKPPPPELEWEDMEYDEYDDPRAELVQRLIEYRKYKEISGYLREKELERSMIYTREPIDLTPYAPDIQENPLNGLEIADLVNAFRKALRKMTGRQAIAKIRKDEISVKDRMVQVLESLSHFDGKVRFSELMEEDYSREELVVTFLALLELMKMKTIRCHQHHLFDDIVIERKREIEADELIADEIDY